MILVTGASGNVGSELVQNLTVNKNVSQTVVVVTEDKVRLCLKDCFKDYCEDMTAKTAWVSPLGILVALIATLVATDFHDAPGFSKSQWLPAARFSLHRGHGGAGRDGRRADVAPRYW